MLMTSGMNVAMGLAMWTEAYHDLMNVARKFGLYHLPQERQHSFTEWLAKSLTDEVAAAEPVADEAMGLVEKCLRLPAPEAVALAREFLGHGR